MKRTRVLGCDISKYQYQWNPTTKLFTGKVDFIKMRQAGATFCIIKVSDPQEVGGVDPCFRRSWDGAKSWMPRGGYHFYRPEVRTSIQITDFLNALNGDWGEKPPVLDVEVNKAGISITSFRTGVRLWLQEIEKATGFIPWIYTRKSFWDIAIGNWDLAGFYPFHCAQYDTPNLIPLIPVGCRQMVAHQFSADGNLRGPEFGVVSRSIDLDYEFVVQ